MLRRTNQNKHYSSRIELNAPEFTVTQQFKIKTTILANICPKCKHFVEKLIDDFNYQIYVLKTLTDDHHDEITPSTLHDGKIQTLTQQNFALTQRILFLENAQNQQQENSISQPKEINFLHKQLKILFAKSEKNLENERQKFKLQLTKLEDSLQKAYAEIDEKTFQNETLLKENLQFQAQIQSILEGNSQDEKGMQYLQKIVQSQEKLIIEQQKQVENGKLASSRLIESTASAAISTQEIKILTGKFDNLQHELNQQKQKYTKLLTVNQQQSTLIDRQREQILMQLNQLDLQKSQIDVFEQEIVQLTDSQKSDTKLDLLEMSQREFSYVKTPRRPVIGNVMQADIEFIEQYQGEYEYQFDKMVFYDGNKKILLSEYYSVREQIFDVNNLKQTGVPLNIAVRAANEEKLPLDAVCMFLSTNDYIYSHIQSVLPQKQLIEIVKIILAQYKVGISRGHFWIKKNEIVFI